MAREVLLEAKLETRDAEAAADRLDAELADVGRSLERNLKRAALAVTGVIVAFGEATRRASENARELSNLARNAGLATDQYQRLNAAFVRFGGDNDTLLTLINDVSDRIGDAAAGAQGYRDDLAEVGLSYATLAQQSPVEQVLAVVDALEKEGNAARRSFVGNSLLGGEYEKIRGIIEGGGVAAIEAWGQALEDSGNISTNLANRNLRSLASSMDLITGAIQTGFVNAVGEAGDQLGLFGNNTIGLARRLGELTRELTTRFINALRTAIDFTIRWRKVIIALGAAFAAVKIGAFIASINPLTVKLALVAAAVLAVVAAITGVAVVVANVAKSWDLWVEAGRRTVDALKALFGTLPETLSFIGRNIVQSLLSSFDKLLELIQNVLNAYNIARAAIGLNPILVEIDLGTLLDDALANAENKTKQAADNLKEALGPEGVATIVAAMNALGTATENTTAGIKDDFAGLLAELRGLLTSEGFDFNFGGGNVPELPPLPTGQGTSIVNAPAVSQRIQDVAEDISTNLLDDFRNAFKTGDFSELGNIFLQRVRAAMVDTLFDRLDAFLQGFFQRLLQQGNESALNLANLFSRPISGVNIRGQRNEGILGRQVTNNYFNTNVAGNVDDSVRRTLSRDVRTNANILRQYSVDHGQG